MRGVVAGIQARLNSERFPGKVLQQLGGKTLLERVCAAAKAAAPVLSETWVVTGPEAENRSLIEHCVRLGIPYLTGHPLDVQSRYVALQRRTNAAAVLRLTADNPLVQSASISEVARALMDDPELDYAANCAPQTWPLGLNVEGFSAGALRRISGDPTPDEREHVTLRLKRQPDRYRTRNFAAEGALHWPDLRLTVDVKEDLEFIEDLFRRFGERVNDLPFLLERLRAEPQLITRAHPKTLPDMI